MEKKILGFRNMQEKLEMVFCFKNCSDLVWEKFVPATERKTIQKFESEGREFSNFEDR